MATEVSTVPRHSKVMLSLLQRVGNSSQKKREQVDSSRNFVFSRNTCDDFGGKIIGLVHIVVTRPSSRGTDTKDKGDKGEGGTRGDRGIGGQGDKGTGGQGDRGQRDRGTGGQGDKGTRGQGEQECARVRVGARECVCVWVCVGGCACVSVRGCNCV